jgi:hypothetical protein
VTGLIDFGLDPSAAVTDLIDFGLDPSIRRDAGQRGLGAS